MARKKTWVKSVMMNDVLSGEGFYISFNDFADGPPFGIKGFKSNLNSVETALCDPSKEKTKYYILNGDFRKDYEKLIDKGFKACHKFYLSKKKEFHSSWSTDYKLNK